jgi:hypothetical protein
MTRFRLLAVVPAAVLAIAACSAGKPGPSGHPGPTARATDAPRTGAAPQTDLSRDVVIARRLNPTAEDGFAVLFGGSGEVLFPIPDGAASPGFRRIATATTDGSSTAVRFLAGEGGEVREERRLDGTWQLPTIGVTKRKTGISADGSTVVLEQPHSASRETTNFAIVTAGATKTRIVTFRGDLSFDALSPDGAWLYVIDHRGGGVYQVRKASTATGALDPNVIVDKRKLGEVMAGYAITQLTGRDGWVYTLYQGPEGPFVHALHTGDGAAACIDLPQTDKAVDTDATAAAWGLALAHGGRSLFAVNSALGTVSELSLEDFDVTRTAELARQSAGIELAKFENGKWNDAGSVAVSPDGKVLYVGGEHGVSAVGTADLAPLATLGGDRGYRSLAVSAGGQVYAVASNGDLHRLGSSDEPADKTLATGVSVIEGVMTLGG